MLVEGATKLSVLAQNQEEAQAAIYAFPSYG